MENTKIKDKIIKFEYKFNNREISSIEVKYLKQDEDYYYADVVICFENLDVEVIDECKYPKKLIDIFEE